MTTLSRTLRAAGLYGLDAQPWFMGVIRVTIDPIFHAKRAVIRAPAYILLSKHCLYKNTIDGI